MEVPLTVGPGALRGVDHQSKRSRRRHTGLDQKWSTFGHRGRDPCTRHLPQVQRRIEHGLPVKQRTRRCISTTWKRWGHQLLLGLGQPRRRPDRTRSLSARRLPCRRAQTSGARRDGPWHNQQAGTHHQRKARRQKEEDNPWPQKVGRKQESPAARKARLTPAQGRCCHDPQQLRATANPSSRRRILQGAWRW